MNLDIINRVIEKKMSFYFVICTGFWNTEIGMKTVQLFHIKENGMIYVIGTKRKENALKYKNCFIS